jgi:hypothetical protein
LPPKRKFYKNPTIQQALSQIDTKSAELRIALCEIPDENKEDLRLIANTAINYDFRYIAINKLALSFLGKYHWLQIKPKKLCKLSAAILGVDDPTFTLWVEEVLIECLSKEQLEYIAHKSKNRLLKQLADIKLTLISIGE